MKDSSLFNFFSSIFETEGSPHARTLRTDFKQKLKDGFFVIAGTLSIAGIVIIGRQDSSEQDYFNDHFGVLDCLTLFIPAIIECVTALIFMGDSHPAVKFTLGLILGLIAVPIAIIRIVLAGVIVANPLSLLVIFVVDLVAQDYAGGAELKQQVANMPMSSDDNAQPINYSSANFVPVSNKQKILDNRAESAQNSYHLPVFSKAQNNNEVTAMELTCGDNPYKTPLFTNNGNQLNDSSRAYFMLNINRATEAMEIHTNKYQDNQPADDQNYGEYRKVLALLSP